MQTNVLDANPDEPPSRGVARARSYVAGVRTLDNFGDAVPQSRLANTIVNKRQGD